jgi:hypothetical protein
MHSDAGIQIKAGLTGKLIRAVAPGNNREPPLVYKRQQSAWRHIIMSHCIWQHFYHPPVKGCRQCIENQPLAWAYKAAYDYKFAGTRLYAPHRFLHACPRVCICIKPLTAGEVERILRANGYVFSRIKGSHFIWKNT